MNLSPFQFVWRFRIQQYNDTFYPQLKYCAWISLPFYDWENICERHTGEYGTYSREVVVEFNSLAKAREYVVKYHDERMMERLRIREDKQRYRDAEKAKSKSGRRYYFNSTVSNYF